VLGTVLGLAPNPATGETISIPITPAVVGEVTLHGLLPAAVPVG
jgi:hypothetical protein